MLKMKNLFQIHNLHLSISATIVLAIAFVYGLLPQQLLPNPFDFELISTDLANILKAIMGLYVAFALFWLLGIYNQKYYFAATVSNALFMLGLGFGRIISCAFDGIPSPIFVLGTFGELFLGVYSCLIVLQKQHKT